MSKRPTSQFQQQWTQILHKNCISIVIALLPPFCVGVFQSSRWQDKFDTCFWIGDWCWEERGIFVDVSKISGVCTQNLLTLPHSHLQCSPFLRSPELYSMLCTSSGDLWQGWRCSSLLVAPQLCAPFPVTSVGCCWVPAKFPCWVSVLHRSSVDGLPWQDGSRSGSRVCVWDLTPSPSGKFPRGSRESLCSSLGPHSSPQ
jgi:hypothetical protein